MQVGDTVRFREFLEAGDDVLRFRVVRTYDDRVIVTALKVFDNWYLKPIHEYRVSDMEICE